MATFKAFDACFTLYPFSDSDCTYCVGDYSFDTFFSGIWTPFGLDMGHAGITKCIWELHGS